MLSRMVFAVLSLFIFPPFIFLPFIFPILPVSVLFILLPELFMFPILPVSLLMLPWLFILPVSEDCILPELLTDADCIFEEVPAVSADIVVVVSVASVADVELLLQETNPIINKAVKE